MTRKTLPAVNYLELVPTRTVASEPGEGGLVVLLRPKWVRGLFARWLQPRLPPHKRHFKVRLDDVGTAVWNAIDGERSVGDLAELLYERFGDRVEPRYERVSRFIHSLDDGAMVTLAPPAGAEASRGTP